MQNDVDFDSQQSQYSYASQNGSFVYILDTNAVDRVFTINALTATSSFDYLQAEGSGAVMYLGVNGNLTIDIQNSLFDSLSSSYDGGGFYIGPN